MLFAGSVAVGLIGLEALDLRTMRRIIRQPGQSADDERAVTVAAVAVASDLERVGFVMDYKPSSLSEVDRFIDSYTVRGKQRFRSPLYESDDEWVIVALGAYVGWVLYASLVCEWDFSDHHPVQGVVPRVVFPDGRWCRPMQMVARRFASGEAPSIVEVGRDLGVPA
jgi:hypothetical protein